MALGVLLAVLFLTFLDNTIVSVALGSVQSDLHAGVTALQWVVSAVTAVTFFWWESRAAHPLLDLRYLRVPRFLTANVVAFCAYFATFPVDRDQRDRDRDGAVQRSDLVGGPGR